RNSVAKSAGPASDRTTRDDAIRLADPGDDFAKLRATPGGVEIIDSWARRREALARYRDELRTETGPDPSTVLHSLLHMHHIRINGLDERAEQECRRLARAAALAWAARTPP